MHFLCLLLWQVCSLPIAPPRKTICRILIRLGLLDTDFASLAITSYNDGVLSLHYIGNMSFFICFYPIFSIVKSTDLIWLIYLHSSKSKSAL